MIYIQVHSCSFLVNLYFAIFGFRTQQLKFITRESDKFVHVIKQLTTSLYMRHNSFLVVFFLREYSFASPHILYNKTFFPDNFKFTLDWAFYHKCERCTSKFTFVHVHVTVEKVAVLLTFIRANDTCFFLRLYHRIISLVIPDIVGNFLSYVLSLPEA